MTRPVGRIRDRSTFRALSRPEGRATRGPVRVTFVPPPPDRPTAFVQVGYAISRHHGSAVIRNRLRRRLRAAVREASGSGDIPAGAYLVRPAPGAADVAFGDLADLVSAALAAAGAAGTQATTEAGK